MEKEEERIYNLSIDNDFIDKAGETDIHRCFEHKEHFYLIKQSIYSEDCFDCIFAKQGDCNDVYNGNNSCKREDTNIEIVEISKDRFEKINRINGVLDSVKKIRKKFI